MRIAAVLGLSLTGWVLACSPRERTAEDDSSAAVAKAAAADRGTLLLYDQISGQLGTAWKVDREVERHEILATRNIRIPNADGQTARKLYAQAQALRGEHPELTLEFRPATGTARLSGRTEDCRAVANIVPKLAQLDGVNEIYVMVPCTR